VGKREKRRIQERVVRELGVFESDPGCKYTRGRGEPEGDLEKKNYGSDKGTFIVGYASIVKTTQVEKEGGRVIREK